MNSPNTQKNNLTLQQEKRLLTDGVPNIESASYTEYPSFMSQTSDELKRLNLRTIWNIIYRHKLIIASITLLVFLITLYSTLTARPTYQATGTIQIDSENSSNILSYDVDARKKRSNARYQFRTKLQQLKSRALARAVIDELNLENRASSKKKELAKPFFSAITDRLNNAMTRALGTTKEKLGKSPFEVGFLARLTVKPIPKSNVVEVRYVSKDPKLAALIVNTVAKQFIQMNLDRRISSAKYAENFLEEQLLQAKSRLQESEGALLKYARDRDILVIKNSKTGNMSLSTQSLTELNTMLAKAEQKRMDLESIYTLTKDENKAINEQKNDVIKELKRSRATLQAEYQEKLSTYKPQYPLMLQLTQQIAEINNQIEIEAAQSRIASDATYRAAQRNEADLRERYEQNKRDYMTSKDNSLQYNTLNREVTTNQQIYNDLLQRIREVGVAGSIEKNNISILDPAITPYFKHSPRVKKNLTWGLFLGLFLGIGLAFILHYLDDTIKSAEDLELLTHTTVLGMIPHVKTRKADAKQLALMSANTPNSPITEAIKTLYAKLLFSTPEGMPKSLVITSAAPSEGKSNLALNLATTLAQSGKSVLLIDCDLRKPSVHKLLDLDNNDGLTSILTKQLSEKEATIATDIDGLYVITSGSLAPNPIELLSSERMLGLLQKAYEKFDHIILDSPPVMGLADALVLSDHASATLFVSAYGQAKKAAIHSAYKHLKEAQANVIGTVLTKMKNPTGGQYNYDYYYYYQNPSLDYSKSKTAT